jgi:hypothetical protein
LKEAGFPQVYRKKSHYEEIEKRLRIENGSPKCYSINGSSRAEAVTRGGASSQRLDGLPRNPANFPVAGF